MKSLIVVCALIAVVTADVSHLNNMYLPPIQSAPGGVAAGESAAGAYAALSEEIPQVIGANTHTPAHLLDLPVVQSAQSEPVEEPQVEIAVQDTHAEQQQEPEGGVQSILQVSPAQSYAAPAPSFGSGPLLDALSQPEVHVHQEVSNGIDTQYGSNGGYIY